MADGESRLSVASLLVLAAVIPARPARAVDAARGHALYMRDGCVACHGHVAQGGRGPRLAPDVMPFEAFRYRLRHPEGWMPIYTPAELPRAQAADIYAYLKTIPSGRAATKIPLLMKMDGR